MSCAETKRIFEASCIDIFRTYAMPMPAAIVGSRTTTASPSINPFLVPPNDTMSTPASVVSARSGTPSVAAAFASRAPSR